MQIGEIAKQANVSIQTLRYYERLGLVAAPGRHRSGFRRYETAEVRRVRFIKRAQDLGFTLAEIGDLLNLWEDSAQSCVQVERRASATLDRIETKIRDLEIMRTALSDYVAVCRTRDSLEQCPLLHALGDEGATR